MKESAIIKVSTNWKEPSLKAWFWRVLIGPATIVQGVVATLTLGTVSVYLSVECARWLAKARIEATGFKRTLNPQVYHTSSEMFETFMKGSKE